MGELFVDFSLQQNKGSGLLKREFAWIFAETCNSLSPFYKRLKTIKSAVITSEIQGERGNQIPKPYLNSNATIQTPNFRL